MEMRNYRTIMVSHVLAQIYGSIMEEHIGYYVESRGLRAIGQAGFRKQHSTLDHTFTLRALIEEARYNKQKLYCCFVDFKKAFDTVPRVRLMQRLKEMGVLEDMQWGVAKLYEKVTGKVRATGGWSTEIRNTTGVKQGCPLSPTLLGLYIDEVVEFIHRGGGVGSMLSSSTVKVLLYADDIVLISSTAEGLQQHLDALEEFCCRRDLQVNLGKTKIIILNTSKVAMRRQQEFLFKRESGSGLSICLFGGNIHWTHIHNETSK